MEQKPSAREHWREDDRLMLHRKRRAFTSAYKASKWVPGLYVPFVGRVGGTRSLRLYLALADFLNCGEGSASAWYELREFGPLAVARLRPESPVDA